MGQRAISASVTAGATAPVLLTEPLAAAVRPAPGGWPAATCLLGGGGDEDSEGVAGGVEPVSLGEAEEAHGDMWSVLHGANAAHLASPRVPGTANMHAFAPQAHAPRPQGPLLRPPDPSRGRDASNAPGEARPHPLPATRADERRAAQPAAPDPSTLAVAVAQSDLGAAGHNAAMLPTLERLYAASVSARSLVHRDRNWILRTAVAQASPGSVWQSSEPVAALFCQRLMWLVAVVMAVTSAAALAALCLAAADTLDGWELVEARRFRFTTLESRGSGAAPPRSPGISAFGLTTAAGCDVWPAADGANVTVAGPSMTVAFAEPVAAAGWWFQVLRPGAPADDPVRFILEQAGEGSDGADWEVVGGSSPAVLLWSGTLLQPGGADRYPTSLAVAAEVERFSLRTPWTWWMQRLGYMFVIMAGFGGAAAASSAGRPLASLVCSNGLMTGLWLVDGAAAAAFAATGQTSVAWVAAVCAACEVCGLLALAFHQLLFRVWCLGAGATFAVVLFAHYLSLGLDPVPEILSAGIYRNHNTAQGVFAFAVGVHGFVSGWLSRCRARGLVAGDREAYGELWEACCARDAGGASRAALAAAVAGLAATLPVEPVRQRCAPPGPPRSGPGSPASHGGEADMAPSPLASLQPGVWRSAASFWRSAA